MRIISRLRPPEPRGHGRYCACVSDLPLILEIYFSDAEIFGGFFFKTSSNESEASS